MDMEKSLAAARQRGQLAFQLRTTLLLAQHKGSQEQTRQTLEAVLTEFANEAENDELNEARSLLQAFKINE
jgi:hypothetical protein